MGIFVSFDSAALFTYYVVLPKIPKCKPARLTSTAQRAEKPSLAWVPLAWSFGASRRCGFLKSPSQYTQMCLLPRLATNNIMLREGRRYLDAADRMYQVHVSMACGAHFRDDGAQQRGHYACLAIRVCCMYSCSDERLHPLLGLNTDDGRCRSTREQDEMAPPTLDQADRGVVDSIPAKFS